MDISRKATFNQKRGVCIAAYHVVEGTDINEVDLSVSINNILGTLPENTLITDAKVFVKTASDAATSAVITIGTTDGGSEIMSAGDLAATGESGTFTGVTDTGSGVDVYVNATITGASTNVGDYVIRIEYVEYDLKTGNYTSFAES
jgi:hypothetical protein